MTDEKGFIRCDGFGGSVPQGFINKNLPVCPLCGSPDPYWLLKNKMEFSGHRILFRCSRCGGIISATQDDFTGRTKSTVYSVLSTGGTINALTKKKQGKDVKTVYIKIEDVSDSGNSKELEGKELPLEEVQAMATAFGAAGADANAQDAAETDDSADGAEDISITVSYDGNGEDNITVSYDSDKEDNMTVSYDDTANEPAETAVYEEDCGANPALRHYKDLLEEGVITEADFEAKKAQLGANSETPKVTLGDEKVTTASVEATEKAETVTEKKLPIASVVLFGITLLCSLSVFALPVLSVLAAALFDIGYIVFRRDFIIGIIITIAATVMLVAVFVAKKSRAGSIMLGSSCFLVATLQFYNVLISLIYFSYENIIWIVLDLYIGAILLLVGLHYILRGKIFKTKVKDILCFVLIGLFAFSEFMSLVVVDIPYWIEYGENLLSMLIRLLERAAVSLTYCILAFSLRMYSPYKEEKQ